VGPITDLDVSEERKISYTYFTISGRGIFSDSQKYYLCISFLRKCLWIKQLSKTNLISTVVWMFYASMKG
jgi:hypothetical protein